MLYIRVHFFTTCTTRVCQRVAAAPVEHMYRRVTGDNLAIRTFFKKRPCSKKPVLLLEKSISTSQLTPV